MQKFKIHAKIKITSLLFFLRATSSFLTNLNQDSSKQQNVRYGIQKFTILYPTRFNNNLCNIDRANLYDIMDPFLGQKLTLSTLKICLIIKFK